MRGVDKRRYQARGQAIVEFAIVVPVMMLLLLLAVDFGRLFFTYVAVNNAAREATYEASRAASDASFDQTAFEAGVTQAALREANSQAQGGEGSMTVDPPACFVPATSTTMACDTAANFAGGIGNHVSVSVNQPFTFLTPIIGDLFGGQLTLTASATAPVLNPPNVAILAVPTPTPTATPTPTPTPTSTPSPTPSATAPGATPTPTPTPTPVPTPTPPPTCEVPDLFNQFYNDTGLSSWQQQGFTGTLVDTTGGKKIKSQTTDAGNIVLCSASMTVDDKI